MTDPRPYHERMEARDFHIEQIAFHQLRADGRRNPGWHRYQIRWHQARANELITFHEIVSEVMRARAPLIAANVERNNALLSRLKARHDPPNS